METINERLKYLRKKLGLSQAAFGDKIRITKASVSRIESGINNPSDQTITLICKEFNISEHWLITGEGEQTFSTKEALWIS